MTTAVENLVATLKQVKLGPALSHGGLTLIPLMAKNGHKASYLMFDEALKTGLAEIDEVDEDGDVNALRVINRGKKPLLIPEGAIICGMKQTRMVWITVLVAAKSEFMLPVNCVEHGRWRRTGRQASPEIYAHPGLRARNYQSRSRSRRRQTEMDGNQTEDHSSQSANIRHQAVAAQGDVWDYVTESLGAMNTESATESLEDAYTNSRQRQSTFRETFVFPEKACGIVLGYAGQVLGIDMFDSPAALGQLWPKLSESYFVEALRRGESKKKLKKKQAQDFLTQVAEAARASEAHEGIGQRVEIDQKNLAGSALCHAGHVCHLSAYAVE